MTKRAVPNQDRDSFPTSSSLLQRVRAKEPAAWARLVDLYSPLIYLWCRRSGLQRSDATDVSQEVFRAVHRKIDEFRHDRSGDSFRGWLKRITENKIRDHWRANQREPRGAGGSDAQRQMARAHAPEEEPLSSVEESAVLFREALKLIRGSYSEQSWQAFCAVVVEERSPADVAAELKVSVNSVYLAKSRILRRLRDEFSELIETDER